MQYITQKLEQTIYGYDTSEFFPIWEGGQLRNRNDFIKYKIKKIFRK